MNDEPLSCEELAEIKRDLVAGDAPAGLKITARYLATIERDRELLRELVDVVDRCLRGESSPPRPFVQALVSARQVLGIEATDE